MKNVNYSRYIRTMGKFVDSVVTASRLVYSNTRGLDFVSIVQQVHSSELLVLNC